MYFYFSILYNMKIYSKKDILKTGFWFFLFNTLLAIVISLRDFRYLPELDGVLPYIYLICTEISHIALLSFLCYLVLYVPIALLVRHKGTMQWWAMGIACLGLIILLIDSFVFDLYRFHINEPVLDMVFGASPGNVFQINFSQYVLVIAILSIILVAERFVFRFIFKLVLSQKLKGIKYACIALVCIGITANVIHTWAKAADKQEISQLTKYFPAFVQFEASDLLYNLGLVKNPHGSNEKLIFEPDEKLNYPKVPLEFTSRDAAPNILFLVIDGWNPLAFDSITTPAIYHFQKESVVFSNHYSGSNGTQYGITSLLYGLPGIYFEEMVKTNTPPVLIQELLNRKYEFLVRTSATIKNPPFDKSIFYPIQNQLKELTGIESYDRDIQVMEDWLSFTSERQKEENTNPFFGFLFFDGLHSICQPPFSSKKFPTEWNYAQYEKLNNNFDRDIFFNLYKNIAAFEDSLVDKILIDLKERKLLNNTIVIITSDHGQEFNENKKNYWGHNSNYSKYQLQVPFIMHFPDSKQRTYTHWTAHYDVVPTLLSNFLQCKNPASDYCVGKSLFDKREREYLFVSNVNNSGKIGIVYPDKIINILSKNNYEMLDKQLNIIKNKPLDISNCNKIIQENYDFFRK